MKTFNDIINDKTDDALNENSDGNYMVISNVKQLLRAAQYLNEKIKLGDDVEGWVVDKLAKASNDIHIIHEFYMNLGHTIKTFKEVVNPGNYEEEIEIQEPQKELVALPKNDIQI